MSSMLEHLATLYGFQADYQVFWRRQHGVTTQTQRALLEAMGVPADSEMAYAQAVAEWEARRWRRVLAPAQVVRRTTTPIQIELRLPASHQRLLHWLLLLEDGNQHKGTVNIADLPVLEQVNSAGVQFRRYHFTLPFTPPPGYHGFEIADVGGSTQLRLIVTPEVCYQPEAVQGERRVWGPTVQLYALRSQRNWGIGDFTDLRMMLTFLARAGAGVVGFNPVHALFPHNPTQRSPYSPSSRLYLNILYLDIEAMPDFADCKAAHTALHGPQFQARLRALRGRELVDYAAVAAAKFPFFELLYRHFREHHLGSGDERDEAFRDFQAVEGEVLRTYALFEALQEYFQHQNPSMRGWQDWPAAYRDPASTEVAAFLEAYRERVEFYEYLQWQAASQLSGVDQRARELDLKIGLYQSLAVSVDPNGAETWGNQPLYALNASIGTPPDEFNLKGQDWGQPPLVPERLQDAAYAPFIAAVRKAMRHAGALRIGHAMGLARLFWIPAGGTPADGAYVSYPFADLLGMLALESQRNQCLVVADDLGTVPPAVREALATTGVFSSHLLLLEKAADGGFKAPAAYPRQALVAVSSHDLPTLKGYWQGYDLDVRRDLDLYPLEAERAERIVARAQDQARLLVALEREDLLPPGISAHPVSAPEMTPELARAVQLYLARSPARLLLIQPEDVLGQLEQVNLPGTTDQYPNWRRKLPLNLEEWTEDPRITALVTALQEACGKSTTLSVPSAVPMQVPAIAARIPLATYRLQFNRDFTFAQATELISYLQALGISHCYASPYLKARPGSLHGYDIIDHNALNPEIGSLEDFERLVAALQQQGMGQILDIVPNHMGVMGSDNGWWLDVLENGQASSYADFFDIDWEPLKDELRGKLLVPVLGDQYGNVLERGELKLVFDTQQGEFSIWYYTHRFPVDPKTYPQIIGYRLERLAARLGPAHPQVLEFQSLLTALGHLPSHTEIASDKLAERNRDKEIHKRYLAALCAGSPDIAQYIEENVKEINGTAGDPKSFDWLHELIEVQAYRLAYWRVAADDINYRRFFDINDLAALRMEKEAVFTATHRLVFELIATGKVDGLRIDHPDGLYDPTQYFQRLQQRRAELGKVNGEDKPLYVVVEKIRASYEHIPRDWAVYGGTGYRFANLVNGLFVDSANQARLDRIYAGFLEERLDFDEMLYRCKKLIMKVALASELNVLANQLSRIAQADRHTCDLTLNSLRDALTEIVACFPVYRTYITGERITSQDQRFINWAVATAKKRSQAADITVFDFVHAVLLLTLAEGKSPAFRAAVTAFTKKFQQFTSPVMAKSLEDTSFYIYNRLVSLNDVGGDPKSFGISVAAFHGANQERMKSWPHTLLNTSTHDSKRSEDVRARLNVLSEIPARWRLALRRWSRLNRSRKRQVDGKYAPSRNDEYLLYQTLLGAWPVGELDQEALADFCQREEHYLIKVVREAKVHSSWINPNTAYEEAVVAFIRALLLTPYPRNLFLADFAPLQAWIARIGLFNSLSQTLLKLTVPGVPDIYQGCELWQFSLVDPDNRRPVDFAQRQALLKELQVLAATPTEALADAVRCLLDTLEDGRCKLYLTWKALELRNRYPQLFQQGSYLPLRVEGAWADHLCAFARQSDEQTAIVAVPRLCAGLLGEQAAAPLGPAVWDNTRVELPSAWSGTLYRHVLTGEHLQPVREGDKAFLPVSALLACFPVALLCSS